MSPAVKHLKFFSNAFVARRKHGANVRAQSPRGLVRFSQGPRQGALIALLTLGLAPFASAQFVVTRTFTPGVLVPDSGEIADVRNVNVGGGTISGVEVDVVLRGVNGQPMFNGDYYITLGHGTGSAVLLNRPGVAASATPTLVDQFGYADNGIAATFRDGAANGNVHFYRDSPAAPAAGGILTGTWAPDGRLTDPTAASGTATLSTFTGGAPSGEWRLFIADQGAGGTAQLDLWRLRLTITPDGTSQLNLNDAQLAIGSAQTFTNPLNATGTNRISTPVDASFQGSFTGNGMLTKEGSGMLTLTQPDVYTGSIDVAGGRLHLPSGMGGLGGGITVDSGAQLSGGGAITRDVTHQGTISGPSLGSGEFLTFNGSLTGAGNFQGRIQTNGAFSPGNSPAIVTFAGDYTLGSTSLLTMEIGGLTPGTLYDQIRVTHTLTYGGTLAVALLNGFTPGAGQSFQLFTTGTTVGSFADFQLPTLSGSLGWDTTRLASQGVLGVTAIPEPSTVALLAGVATFAAVLWRRRRTQLKHVSRRS